MADISVKSGRVFTSNDGGQETRSLLALLNLTSYSLRLRYLSVGGRFGKAGIPGEKKLAARPDVVVLQGLVEIGEVDQ